MSHGRVGGMREECKNYIGTTPRCSDSREKLLRDRSARVGGYWVCMGTYQEVEVLGYGSHVIMPSKAAGPVENIAFLVVAFTEFMILI